MSAVIELSIRVLLMAVLTAATLRLLRIRNAEARPKAWTAVLAAMLLLYGDAVFFANLALGEAALKRGERREAARYLLTASEAPPSDRLRYGEITMTLARQLVDWGEREAVATFLERCAKFNKRGKEMAEWAAQLRKGMNPDLLPYRT